MADKLDRLVRFVYGGVNRGDEWRAAGELWATLERAMAGDAELAPLHDTALREVTVVREGDEGDEPEHSYTLVLVVQPPPGWRGAQYPTAEVSIQWDAARAVAETRARRENQS